MVLPRDQIDKAAGGRRLHGMVIGGGAPIARMLTGFAANLPQVVAGADSADMLAIEDATLGLFTSALAHHAPGTALYEPALSGTLRRAMLDFIDANLGDPKAWHRRRSPGNSRFRDLTSTGCSRMKAG